MAERCTLPPDALLQKAKDVSVWTRVHAGSLRRVLQDESPSKAIPGGISRLYSYYDGAIYVATFHQLFDSAGQPTMHDHPKDLRIGECWIFSEREV